MGLSDALGLKIMWNVAKIYIYKNSAMGTLLSRKWL